MKKSIYLLLIASLFACTPQPSCDVQPITKMIIKNSDTQSVVVVLTLGSADSSLWIQNVKGIFGINDSGLVGMFTLKPGETRSFTPNKAIQGQFCFNSAAYQCATDSMFTGTTLTEFCLNNFGTVENAQETVDISCVAGISYIASIEMYDGGIWTANHVGFDTINRIRNYAFGLNTNKVGVYPVGCDDCDSSVAPPQCVIGHIEKPSMYPICQVQRNASESGGIVMFTYISKAYQILK
jgi:hypothetical protein